MNRRTNIIWTAVCLSVMIICIVLGARYREEYIGLGGVIFCFVGLTILGIVNKIIAMRAINRELKELAKEDSECPENVGELAQACFGITKEVKRNLKTAPLGDRLKIISMFVSVGLLLLTMFVGIILSKLGTLNDGTITQIATIGFVLMGIGGGGFFLEILLLGIISGIKNRKNRK